MAEPARLCISGIGIVSGLGDRPSDVWSALDRGAFPASVPEFDPAPYLKRRFLRPLDAVTQRCIAMVGAAARDAGLDAAGVDPSRVGIVIGSVFAGIGCIFEFKRAIHERAAQGYAGLSPLYFPGIVFNSLSGQAAIEFGFTGPNAVINAGWASGLAAVIRAAAYLRAGKADVIIAGGAEMDHPFIRRKLGLAMEEGRLRDYGDGFRQSEGVCLFLLHREDDGRFPRERRYGFLGAAAQGHCRPDTRVAAWERALRGVIGGEPEPGAAVLDGYPGSPGYADEAKALGLALGDGRGVPPPALALHSNKRGFGHALGAAGAFNLFHGLMAARAHLGQRPAIIHAADPGGGFAFMSVTGGSHHD